MQGSGLRGRHGRRSDRGWVLGLCVSPEVRDEATTTAVAEHSGTSRTSSRDLHSRKFCSREVRAVMV